MRFSDILQMNATMRYQYVNYYRRNADEYEEVMLPSLRADYDNALNLYIDALHDSNNPSLVKVMGQEMIDEWTAHCNARVDNLAAFIHEIMSAIQSFRSKADYLEQTIINEFTANGLYNFGDNPAADLKKIFKI